jgi:hypothetical protein
MSGGAVRVRQVFLSSRLLQVACCAPDAAENAEDLFFRRVRPEEEN